MHKLNESTEQQFRASIRVQKAALKTTENWTFQSTQKYQGCLLMDRAGSQYRPSTGLINMGWRSGKHRGKQKLVLEHCIIVCLYSHSTNTGVSASAQFPPKHSCFYTHKTSSWYKTRVPLVCVTL